MIVAIFGLIFFLVNCAFALVLLVLLIIVSIYALISENPDILHEQMEDDRSEFIKSKTSFPSDVELNLAKYQVNESGFKEISKTNDPLSSYDGAYSSTTKINNIETDESKKNLSSRDLITNYITQNSLTVPPQPPFKSSMRSSNDLIKDLQNNKENRNKEYTYNKESSSNLYLPTYKNPSDIQKLNFTQQNSRNMPLSDSQNRQYIPGAPKKTRNYGLYYNTYTNKTV